LVLFKKFYLAYLLKKIQ